MKENIKYLILYPILLIAYLCLLIIDDNVMTNSYYKHYMPKIEGFKEHNNYTNLILGGSNAFYSISAKQLSNSTNENWYNFSILGEGGSDLNYYSFLEENLSYSKRLKIKKVLYSTIYYYRKGSLELRKNSSKLIDGSNKFSIKPSFSGLTYIKRFLSSGRISPQYQQNKFGDIVFLENICKNENIKQNFVIEETDLIINDISNKFKKLNDIFPNAEIYIIFPSDFIYKKNIINYQNQIKNLKFFIEANNNQFIKKSNILFQEPFSYEQLCDTPSHANQNGNKWRTNNIYLKLLNKGL